MLRSTFGSFGDPRPVGEPQTEDDRLKLKSLKDDIAKGYYFVPATKIAEKILAVQLFLFHPRD